MNSENIAEKHTKYYHSKMTDTVLAGECCKLPLWGPWQSPQKHIWGAFRAQSSFSVEQHVKIEVHVNVLTVYCMPCD